MNILETVPTVWKTEMGSLRLLQILYSIFQSLKLLMRTEVTFYRLMHIYLETIISYLPLLLSVTLVCLILEAGAPVYLYEYQHSLKMVQKRRPSFVGSDHTDEIFTVMGFCFTTTHVKLPREWNLKSLIWAWDIWFVSFWGFLGLECRIFYKIITLDPCFVEEEQLSRTMMSYWGNFARTG